MQYIVETSGQVLSQQDKAYVVDAKSKQEAQELAKQQFCDDYYVASTNIQTTSSERTVRPILACIFMAIPVLLSFINYANGHEIISVAPTAISCIFSALLFSAFVVKTKGIQRTIESKIDIVLTCIAVLLLASFIQCLFVDWPMPGLITKFPFVPKSIDTMQLMFIGVLLSWLGMKVASVVCMGIISLIAFSNINNLSNAMGFWGIVYVLCAFIGILLYISIEPALIEALPVFRKQLANGMGKVQNDFSEAGSSVKRITASSLKSMNDIISKDVIKK